MSKRKERKFFRYMGYTLQDAYRFMPVCLCATLLFALVNPVLSIWNPILIADIFEIVPDLNAENLQIFSRDVLILCIIIGLPQVGTLFLRILSTLAVAKKESGYGWKMFEHARRIRLEALENPGVLDAFKKAEMSYMEYGGSATFIMVLVQGVTCAVTCVGMVAVVGRFSLWLIPGAVLGVVPHFVMSLVRERNHTRVFRRQSAVRRRLSYLWLLFCRKESVKEMRVMGFGEYLKQKWLEANDEVIEEIRQVELKGVKVDCVTHIIKNACYAMNVAIALVLMVTGRLAAGQFAACLSAFAVLQSNMLTISFLFKEGMEQYHRLEEYYDFFEIDTEEDGGEEYHPFTDCIRLKDVHFRYDGSDREALKGVDLEIKKGEHVVIVGVNGSGKTTLSKVIAGAYRACGGEVAYDGKDVKGFRRESLYRDVSLVPQDFVHYNFTLGENIFISDIRHREDEKRLRRVIEDVELSEVVSGVGGADAQLGREFDGRELSGGEWQKIAIARGLFKDCGLILLDEPTSALDPLVEYDILTGFMKLIRDKTSVIISHRVGICRLADKVVVMKDGRVVECGTHTELKDAGGEYSRIWREQAKWY